MKKIIATALLIGAAQSAAHAQVRPRRAAIAPAGQTKANAELWTSLGANDRLVEIFYSRDSVRKNEAGNTEVLTKQTALNAGTDYLQAEIKCTDRKFRFIQSDRYDRSGRLIFTDAGASGNQTGWANPVPGAISWNMINAVCDISSRAKAFAAGKAGRKTSRLKRRN